MSSSAEIGPIAGAPTPLARVLHLPFQRHPLEESPSLGVLANPENFLQMHGRVDVPGASEQVKYTLSITTGELQHPELHVFVPGFGGFKRSSRALRDHVAGSYGGVALSYEPLRRGKNPLTDLFHAQRLHANTIDSVVEHASLKLQLVDLPNAEAVNLEAITLDAHSMGGLAATAYALRNSGNVKHVTYLQSVGLEKRPMLGYAPRARNAIAHDFAPAARAGELDHLGPKLEVAMRGLRYYFSGPARTIGEMGSCMSADLLEDIIELGRLGITRAMLYSDLDELVPAQPAIDRTGRYVDDVQIMQNVGHLAPQIRSHQVAGHLVSISQRLARRTAIVSA